ncbi:MAG TPA: DUF2974 domain-containing protein, partial [Arcobacter sp.]|nr:DUF2974 domain-containing protein [Arcobacter sp.]
DYKIYALDFIVKKNRMKQYARLINAWEGDFSILGYSSGGNLAFELIDHLIKKPQKLILVDSWRIKKFNSVDDREFDEELIQNKRINRYVKVLNKMKNIHQQNIQIVLIKAQRDKQVKGNKYIDQKWKFLTKGTFTKYQGFGTHYEMFKEEFIMNNCDLIQKTLEE